MRFSISLYLALGVLVAAEEQKNPLQGLYENLQEPLQQWFGKIKALLPNSPATPINEAVLNVVEHTIEPITLENWKTVLSTTNIATLDNGREWWVLITGGNKTCHRACATVEKAWNAKKETAVLLSALPSKPNLAVLDCEREPVLCNAWSATPSNLWHINLPPSESEKTDIRVIPLNSTSATAVDILEIKTKKTWERVEPLTGMLHPFDGQISKLGLNIYLGYLLWAFSLIPGWTLMLLISFSSRTFM
ncbi:MAG: hypothetical protein M1829_006784 [Trizodia sp. TS-e1964]|nr:MAG: hypothetical protein M1829_006784 [Trizodia sp. TS-e1964]